MLNSTHCKYIFVFSLLFFSWGFFKPSLDSGIEIPHFDKFMHFVIFLWLALFFEKAFQITVVKITLWLLLYGAAVEFIQGQWAGRDASFADLLADMAGVLFYFVAVKNLLVRYGQAVFR